MVRILILLLMLVAALPALAQDAEAPRLELILDARDTDPLEGEMILATLRGTYRQTITREEVKLRPMADFAWVRLGMDRWTEERVEGARARVFERRIAFYPRRPGDLDILPIAHALDVLGADGRRETVTVRSQPVTVTVRPKPAQAGDDWLPLRALELSDSWDVDPAQLADGQSATRRVVLRAFGATPEMMPQQPNLRQPWLIAFTPPEERNFQVTPEGPVSTVIWTWILRPIKGEPGVIPPVTLPWFDIADRAARAATIPATPIGYASFSANAALGWRPLGPAGWAFWGVLALSALAVAGLTLRERAPARHLFARALGRLRRRRLLFELRRLVRRGDATGARRLAARMLETFSSLGEAERLQCLAPADISLFGGHDAEHESDLKTLHARTARATADPGKGYPADTRPKT